MGDVAVLGEDEEGEILRPNLAAIPSLYICWRTNLFNILLSPEGIKPCPGMWRPPALRPSLKLLNFPLSSYVSRQIKAEGKAAALTPYSYSLDVSNRSSACFFHPCCYLVCGEHFWWVSRSLSDTYCCLCTPLIFSLFYLFDKAPISKKQKIAEAKIFKCIKY